MNIPLCVKCGSPAVFPKAAKEPYTCVTCQRAEQSRPSATGEAKAVVSSELVRHDHTCHCGTSSKEPHEIGQHGCVRSMTAAPVQMFNDIWRVDGHEITGYSMREQRGYHKHPCGCWSRWPGSENSISA